jgi:hypothetical protein
MPSQLRTEAYPVFGSAMFPPRADPDASLSCEENQRRIAAAKEVFDRRIGRDLRNVEP